jgi:hypothetical protein
MVVQVGRAPAAGVVARAGTFDLDHFSAWIRQRLARPGAGQDAGQIENTKV